MQQDKYADKIRLERGFQTFTKSKPNYQSHVRKENVPDLVRGITLRTPTADVSSEIPMFILSGLRRGSSTNAGDRGYRLDPRR